jgi:site-specific DNA recombinase
VTCADALSTASGTQLRIFVGRSRTLVLLSTEHACLKRTGKEMRIIVDDGSEPATVDAGLVRLLVRANAIRDQLLADRSLTFEDIAKSEGVVPSYATRLFRLTLLAPDIVSAILSGRHPPELTARRLMDDTRLPLEWNEQRQRLGFASAH